MPAHAEEREREREAARLAAVARGDGDSAAASGRAVGSAWADGAADDLDGRSDDEAEEGEGGKAPLPPLPLPSPRAAFSPWDRNALGPGGTGLLLDAVVDSWDKVREGGRRGIKKGERLVGAAPVSDVIRAVSCAALARLLS